MTFFQTKQGSFEKKPPKFWSVTDRYGGGKEDEARGRREDGVGEVAAAKRFIAGVVES